MATTLGFGAYHTGVVVGGQEYVTTAAIAAAATLHRVAKVSTHYNNITICISPHPHPGPHPYRRRYTFCESGIVSHRPKACGGGATFREELTLGAFNGSAADVHRVVRTMREIWSPGSYVVVGKNCNDFSAAFCAALGAGELPSWINRAATWGALCVGTSGLTAPIVPPGAAAAAAAAADAALPPAPPQPRAAPRAKSAQQQALLDKLKAAKKK